MRAATCLAVGLAAFLAGCGSGAREQLEADVKCLESKCEALQSENETLKAQDTAQNSRMSSLKSENVALKRGWEAERSGSAQQIAQLQNELALARQSAATVAAVAAALKTPMAAPASTSPGAASSGTPMGAVGANPMPITGPGKTLADIWAQAGAAKDPQTAAEAEQLVADLQARINALSPKIGQQRAKISILAHAKIDQRMIPPPGGGIRFVNGEERIYNFEGNDIGPAIKRGDFRTQHDKEAAVQAAREELLSLTQESTSLPDELAAAKAKLAKLRAGQAGT